MRKYISRLIAVAALAALASVSVFADTIEKPVFIRGIRPLGMGGAFVGLADDQNAIFYNPAGITQRQGGLFTLFDLQASVSEDTLKFYQYYQDNEKKLKGFDNLTTQEKIDVINEINDKVITYKPVVRVSGPNMSYINSRWGVGVFGQIEAGFQFNRSLIIPSISFWGNADGVAAIPFAFKFTDVPFLPGIVSLGATAKFIERGRFEELNKSVLEFENFEPQIQMGSGVGADIGALYQPSARWNIGLQVTDVNETTIHFQKVTASKSGQIDREAFDGKIPSEMNAGIAFIPAKIYYWPGEYISTRDRLLFLFDVRDMMNPYEPLLESTFWKKVHMGAEFRWGPVSLRGGFNSGYMAFGAGMRVPYLGAKVEYAYWADELGRYAGQLPEWNHRINLAWSWGDGKGRAYGSDVTSATQPSADQEKVQPAPAATAPVMQQSLQDTTTGQVVSPAVEQQQPSTTPAKQ